MGPGKAWLARPIETWVETTGKGADSPPEFAEGTGGDHFATYVRPEPGAARRSQASSS